MDFVQTSQTSSLAKAKSIETVPTNSISMLAADGWDLSSCMPRVGIGGI